MAIELDHSIVSARDQQKSAERLAWILGVEWSSTGVGPFSPVYVSSSLTLDFITDSSAFPIQHFCFKVSEQEFDEIFGRIKSAGFKYKSKPHGPHDMQINTELGGRIVFWNEPDGHQWEILTQSYARKPIGTLGAKGGA
jgi:catechol 2,3-dioxygenase-like lactoylglutathione lyase family enzyme